jgi:nitrite reductase (NADH) small subunit/3-phenylpropionate/trans-cinnamate dioxygenase ferredoxin subunit
MPFSRLIEISKCERNRGTFVRHGDLQLAVFLLDDPERVFVIDNTCPHAGGSLSSGEVESDIVSCPYHHWQFDLKTGECVDAMRAQVKSYPAEIRDGAVWADLP